jgi:hypothetical protein
VDERAFVEALMAAVPEAFADERERQRYREEPLVYGALADARIWLEEHALDLPLIGQRRPARVRPEHAGALRRFWNFVEEQAQAHQGDREVETLLQIECFEGVGWVEDVMDLVGPRTRVLLLDAQDWLAPYNRAVGRWSPPSDRKKPRRER